MGSVRVAIGIVHNRVDKREYLALAVKAKRNCNVKHAS